MITSFRRHSAAASAMVAACLLAASLQATPAAAREPKADAVATLIDRAQIQDMITRYYDDLGHGSVEGYTAFYADDGEMVLGGKSYKGKDEIIAAYKAAAGDGSRRRAFAFNIAVNNVLVTLHGDKASVKLIFTEYIAEKQGDAMRILVQGREFSQLVKQRGEWKFAKRQIVRGAEPPPGWTE